MVGVAGAGFAVAHQIQPQPCGGLAVVAIEGGGRGHVGYQQVGVAVVVKIGVYHAARCACVVCACLFGDINKVVALVEIEPVGFVAKHAASAHVCPAVDVAVHIGVGEGDLGVPIPIVGAAGFFFVVGIVCHAVGLRHV